MRSPKLRTGLVVAISFVASSLAISANPVSAAGPTLSVIEASGSTHISGSAVGGNAISAIMSTPLSAEIQPYTYGQYTIIWNLSNTSLKTITEYSVLTYKCSLASEANALVVDPTKCGAPASQKTRRSALSDPWRRTTGWTFVETFGTDALHKKWLRGRLYIKFSDGTSVQSWSKARYYISDAPRVAAPSASVSGADGSSVPQNTALTVTFSKWSGFDNWKVGLPSTLRIVAIYRCPTRPTDSTSTYIATNVTPAGCTSLGSISVGDPVNGNTLSLDITTGAKGTFLYAVDTARFNSMPSVGDNVYLQKRAIFSTYDVSELPTGPAPSADPGAVAGSDPNVAPTPLEIAGINTTTAPIVSTSGQGTINGVTAVIKAAKKYRRGTTRRALSVTFSPKKNSPGSAVIAFVSRVNGVDKVHLVTRKQVRNGKITWNWRFLKKYPRRKYRIYVQFTPSDPAIPPMTLTKRVDLIG